MCCFEEDVRVEVCSVGPDYGSGIRIYGDLSEEPGVLESGKDTASAFNPGTEIDGPRRAVGEGQDHPKWARDLNLRDPRVHGLLQRWNLNRWLIGVEAAPVIEKLSLMEGSPFDDQGQGTRRQPSI
jgi:hypothetical protein